MKEILKKAGSGLVAMVAVVAIVSAVATVQKLIDIDPKVLNCLIVGYVVYTGIKSWEKVQLNK